jgi:hypothetical protein
MVFVINVPLVPLVPPNTESKDRFVITIQYEITLNVGVMWVRMVVLGVIPEKPLWALQDLNL